MGLTLASLFAFERAIAPAMANAYLVKLGGARALDLPTYAEAMVLQESRYYERRRARLLPNFRDIP